MWWLAAGLTWLAASIAAAFGIGWLIRRHPPHEPTKEER